jgi:hypothetical protein
VVWQLLPYNPLVALGEFVNLGGKANEARKSLVFKSLVSTDDGCSNLSNRWHRILSESIV